MVMNDKQWEKMFQHVANDPELRKPYKTAEEFMKAKKEIEAEPPEVTAMFARCYAFLRKLERDGEL